MLREISAKPVGVGAVSQRLVPTGERSGSPTHIATMESVSLCVRIGGVGYQGSWNQAGGKQSFQRSRGRREAEDRAVHRASTFLRSHKGKQCPGSVRWTVFVGKHVWLSPCGNGRPRFLQVLCGDL